MNFLLAQKQARRNTLYLVLLLALGVLALVACVSVALVSLKYVYFLTKYKSSYANLTWWGVLRSSTMLVVGTGCIITTFVVGAGLSKLLELSKGGRVVAERLGAIRLNATHATQQERKILNIVEEMALASGIRPLPVYVLHDDTINAFAAGTSAHDAVIGISQGALTYLTREELQGVVAHEFSHVFHGDMLLNMRIVGLLHGLFFLSHSGEAIIEGLSGGEIGSPSVGDFLPSRWVILSWLAGGILMAAGATGTFFASLIRAAVSRQREFLADAAAVQFTRNSAGIAGALKKIGGHVEGSIISSVHASEFSHMYLNTGCRRLWGEMWATHPPLEERIRRIEPRWRGEYIVPQHTAEASTQPTDIPVTQFQATTLLAPPMSDTLLLEDTPHPPTSETHAVTPEMAQPLVAAAHSAQSAPLLLAALVLHTLNLPPSAANTSTPAPRALDAKDVHAALPNFRQQAPGHVRHEFHFTPAQMTLVTNLDPGLHLQILDLTLSTLESLPQPLLRTWVDDLSLYVEKHSRTVQSREQLVSCVLAWSYVCIARAQYEHTSSSSTLGGTLPLNEAAQSVQSLLGMLAFCGQETPQGARMAYARATSSLQLALPWPALTQLNMQALGLAMQHIQQLRWQDQPTLLKAMARCALHDGVLLPLELALIRAAAQTLHCPMPP